MARSLEQERQPHVAAINELFSQLREFSLAAVGREEELGKHLGFGDLLPLLTRVRDLFLRVGEMQLDLAPRKILVDLSSWLNGFNQVIVGIQSFKIDSGADPQARRDQVFTSAQNQLQELELQVATVIPVISALDPRAERLNPDVLAQEVDSKISTAMLQIPTTDSVSRQVGDLVKEAIASKDTEFAQITAYTKKAADAAVQAEQAFKKVGTLAYAQDYKRVADQHQVISIFALASMFVFALAFVTTASGIKVPAPTPGTNQFAELVPALAWPLFFLFGILSTARIFASERHNTVVNRHRQVAISTFQTFIASTQDEPTQNEVLRQAAAAAFAPQPSGYSKAPLEIAPLSLNLPGAAKHVDGG